MYNKKLPPINAEGYLINVDDWSQELAEFIALQENIELDEITWAIINFVRDFYLEYKIMPLNRIITQHIRTQFGLEIGNSIYIQKLFPNGLLRQVSKIAGLPKPIQCL